MTNQMLSIQALRKTFNKGQALEHKALQGINLEMNEGEFICVVGSNGAGKSTLFNCIAGSVMPDSGKIVLDGKDITFVRDYRRSRNLSRVFQDPLKGTSPNLTIAENISLALGRSTHQNPLGLAMKKAKREFIAETLAKFNIGLEDRLDVKVGSLSGAQRQTVCLLMAVIGKPKLLLLDEHTAALDPQATKNVLKITDDAVKMNNTTTIMVTHNMEDALNYGSRTLVMHEGRFIADVSGASRKNMSVDDLVELFHEKTGEGLANDEMMLA